MGKSPLTISDCLACANKLNYKLVNKIFEYDTIILVNISFQLLYGTNVSRPRSIQHHLPK